MQIWCRSFKWRLMSAFRAVMFAYNFTEEHWLILQYLAGRSIASRLMFYFLIVAYALTEFFTFLQLLSLPMDSNVIVPNSVRHWATMSRVLLLQLTPDLGIPPLWVMFASILMVFLLAILVFISMLKKCHMDKLNGGNEFFYTDIVNFLFGVKLLVVFGFIVSVFAFIPNFRSMIGVYDCTSDGEGGFWLDSDGSVQCWHDWQHILLAIVSFPFTLFHVYWSFRLIRVNGSYSGIKYFGLNQQEKGAERRIARSWRGRFFNWSNDNPQLSAESFNPLLSHPFLPHLATYIDLCTTMILVLITIFLTNYPFVNSMFLALASFNYLITHSIWPYRFLSKRVSLVIGSSKFVIFVNNLLFFIDEAVNGKGEMKRTSDMVIGGTARSNESVAFTVTGPIELYLHLIVLAGDFPIGMCWIEGMMRLRGDPMLKLRAKVLAKWNLPSDWNEDEQEKEEKNIDDVEMDRVVEEEVNATVEDKVDEDDGSIVVVDESIAELRQQRQRSSINLSSSLVEDQQQQQQQQSIDASDNRRRRSSRRSTKLSPRSPGSPRLPVND